MFSKEEIVQILTEALDIVEDIPTEEDAGVLSDNNGTDTENDEKSVDCNDPKLVVDCDDPEIS